MAVKPEHPRERRRESGRAGGGRGVVRGEVGRRNSESGSSESKVRPSKFFWMLVRCCERLRWAIQMISNSRHPSVPPVNLPRF